MSLLVGSEDTTYAAEQRTSGTSHIDSFRFIAGSSGTVDSLGFYTGPDTQAATDMYLYMHADAGGAPGAALARGRTGILDEPIAANTWIDVNIKGPDFLGDSVDVVEGTAYWLGVRASDAPLTFYLSHTTAGGGGTGEAYTTSAIGTEIDPFPSHVSRATGPIAIRATGLADTPPDAGPPIGTGLVFHFTGIWKPGETTVPYYGQVVNPIDGETVEMLDDSRTASVTMSTSNPILKRLEALPQQPYATCLKVYDNGVLAFWGLVKSRSVDTDKHTVKYDAVDLSLRLIKHMLRRGDLLVDNGQLTHANHDRGYLSIDGDGLRLLRDAGQVDGSVLPALGIIDGSDDYTGDGSVIGVQRGEQVWNDWLSLCATLGPDFELEPIDHIVQAYARLNVYEHLGTDRSSTVQLHHQTGRQTLDGLSFTEGEEYINMVHVLDRENTLRVTVTNATALARTGPIIAWLNTDYSRGNATDAEAEAVLRAYGEAMIKAYSMPLVAVALRLPLDTSSVYRYRRDFFLGDTVGVAGKDGNVTLPEAPYRITKVTRALEDESVRTGLEVIADRTTDDTIDGTDV